METCGNKDINFESGVCERAVPCKIHKIFSPSPEFPRDNAQCHCDEREKYTICLKHDDIQITQYCSYCREGNHEACTGPDFASYCVCDFDGCPKSWDSFSEWVEKQKFKDVTRGEDTAQEPKQAPA